MYVKNATFKLISITAIVGMQVMTAYADNSCSSNNPNNQNDAIQSAIKRIDLNKIKEQQDQINKDNTLAARIYEATSIPSWRNLAFIRNSRVSGKISKQILLTQTNTFLVSNGHNELTIHQKQLIEASVDKIYSPL